MVQVGWANRKAAPPPAAVAVARTAATSAPSPVPRPRRGGLIAFLLLAVVFFAISTLPPFVTGSLANGAWLARWIVGGILLVLAVQTLFDLAGRRRRAARSGKSA